MARVQDTVKVYMKELESYTNYPSIEKFKVRVLLNELTKQLDSMTIDIDQFLLQNSVEDSKDPLELGNFFFFFFCWFFIYFLSLF